MLRIARNDQTPMEGFDAEAYAKASFADQKNINDLLDEFLAQRQATISLLNSLTDESFAYTGILYNNTITLSALAYHIGGHELHHLNIIRTRYLHHKYKLTK